MAAAIALLAASSCRYITGDTIHGDGNVISQTRSVSGFTSIDASGSGNIYLTQDSVFSVRVETDNNLQQYLEVYKDGNVLRIKQKDHTNLDPTKDIKIYVSAPAFERLSASGSCDFLGQNAINSNSKLSIELSGSSDVTMEIKAPEIFVESSGAGAVTLRGQTKNFTVDGSGSTEVKCFDLLAENSKIETSGSSDVEVFASVKLDVDVSGSGDVKYKGNGTVSQSISGSGSVKKVD